MNDLTQAAHSYLSAGLSIIALDGKAPNGSMHQHGLNSALTGVPESKEDDEILNDVFTNPSTTGIGIVIEYPYFVVDVDGEEGAVQLADIMNVIELPITPTAKTARGLHIWFSDTTPRGSTKLGSKLDIKGQGGYVAAPPSKHPSGATYEWLVPIVDEESGQLMPVMEMPEALERYLQDKGAIDEVPIRKRRAWTLAVKDGRFVSVPAIPNLSAIAKKMTEQQEGNRNHYLYWAACTADDDGVSLDITLRDLGEAAVTAGLTDREARQTIRSAYRRHR